MSDIEDLSRRRARLTPEQRRLLEQRLRGKSDAGAVMARLETRDAVPLSAAQQRQWFLWQLDRGSTAYHLCGGLVLEGEVDVGALEASFHGVVRRHESLRTVFRATGDGLAEQVMRPDAQLQVARH
ncbi:condensation domain-containing protein, partial [Schlegelella sp. S2-27]